MYDPQTGEKQISLCMIVKDESRYLSQCLENVCSLVDEIIIVDTGSKDNTVEIARSFTDSVFSYKWDDHFSHARNHSLEFATKEWILVLDADEVLSPRDHQALRQIVKEGRYDGVYFNQRNYFEDPSAENWCVNQTDYVEAKNFSGYSDVTVLRFFRNLPEIRFEGMIHESVEEALADKRKQYSEIPLHHYRQDAYGTVSNEKREKYLDLLFKEYSENPQSVKTCFLLGRQLYDFEKYPEAIAYLEKAVSLGTPSEIVAENLASAYYQCQMFREAVEALEKVISFNPRYAEAYATMGISAYQLGRVDKGINSLVQAINLCPSSVRSHFNLAAIYFKENRFDDSEEQLKELLKIAPKFSRAYYLLFHIYEVKKDFEKLTEVGALLKKFDPDLYQKVEMRLKRYERMTENRI